MYGRDIHHLETMPLQAPDPSWLDEEPGAETAFVQAWDEAPEQPWEEFSLEHVAPPPPDEPAAVVAPDGTVYVSAGPVDDTVEQAILASGLGAALITGLCLASAFLGFLIGVVVAT